MKCLNPVSLRHKDGEVYLTVPCLKCYMCRIQKSIEWGIRCIHERQFHDDSLFLTLTYDEEKLPENLSISKRELQLFFKKLRKQGFVFRYLACGEYGEKYGRPHYHAIIFGIKKSDVKILEKIWNKGYVYVGDVTVQSARYVANYVLKSVDVCGDRNKPFILMSKGLGKQFVDDSKESLSKTPRITIRGVTVGIPRYYMQKLGLKPSEVFKSELELRKQETIDIHRERGATTDEKIFESVKLSRRQSHKNAVARKNMKKSSRDL